MAPRASTKRPKVTVVWDGNLIELCDQKLGRMTAETYTQLDDLAAQAATIARSIAPVETGRYRGAIANRRNINGKRLGVDTQSYSPHASIVERGRKAGKAPPVAAIAAAFHISERQAYPIARKIAAGTKGKRVMSKTRARMRAPTLAAHIRLGEWLNNLDSP